jgi:hypothetical protein
LLDEAQSTATNRCLSSSVTGTPRKFVNGVKGVFPRILRTEGSDLGIVTDGGENRVAGRDLLPMLGQNVKIAGASAEKDRTRTIPVESVAPVESGGVRGFFQS